MPGAIGRRGPASYPLRGRSAGSRPGATPSRAAMRSPAGSCSGWSPPGRTARWHYGGGHLALDRRMKQDEQMSDLALRLLGCAYDELDAAEQRVLPAIAGRSEERRVGTECVSKCRSRWTAVHKKKKKK